MAKSTKRGSAQLRNVSAAELKKLTTATKGWKVTGWEERGQPPNIDAIVGTLEGKISQVSPTVRRLLTLEQLRELRIFIRGIPRPEFAQLQIAVKHG